jgi:hypothetical protein
LQFYNWCGHIIVTMIIAFFWVLAFEFPMLTIDKYLLGDGEYHERVVPFVIFFLQTKRPAPGASKGQRIAANDK